MMVTGRGVVDQLTVKLHEYILQKMRQKNGDILLALKEGYLATDRDVTENSMLKDDKSGSTAVSAIIRTKENGERWLYTANAGDSRIVLCRSGTAERLTYDHKPEDPSESQRITNAGGFITLGRVACMLAISRSFGDYELKKWVTADPFLKEILLTPDTTRLILACDGLWDVCGDQEAIDHIKEESESATASEKLVQLALRKGSRDNVSVMVVFL